MNKPVKKIEEGHYIAWGGHRNYSFCSGEESFFLLLRQVKDETGDPIYLDTENYKLQGLIEGKGGISGRRIIVEGDAIKPASTSSERFDYLQDHIDWSREK